MADNRIDWKDWQIQILRILLERELPIDVRKVISGKIKVDFEALKYFLSDIRSYGWIDGDGFSVFIILSGGREMINRAIQEYTDERRSMDNRDSNMKYWLVGSYWHGSVPKQKLSDFRKNGIWENGHGTGRFHDRVLNVKKGDVLICKSTYAKGRTGFLRIKARGIVLGHRRGQDHIIEVDWLTESYKIDLPNLGFYRDAIEAVRSEDIETILSAIADAEKHNTENEAYFHALSSKAVDDELMARGFENQGLIGYVFNGMRPNLLTLKQTYNSDTNIYEYYFDADADGISERHKKDFRMIGSLPREGKLLFRKFIRNQSPKEVICCTNPIVDDLVRLDFVEISGNGFGQTFLLDEPRVGASPVYVYSQNSDILLFAPLKEDTSSVDMEIEHEHNLDLLTDVVAKQDFLGRKVLMEKVVYGKVAELWPKLKDDESFTILLNGEWGSGKSSMLHYLEEVLSKDWEVVKYNAWENQHFTEPWWVFVNHVSKQASLKDRSVPSHRWWYFKQQNHSSLIVLVLSLTLVFSVLAVTTFFTSDNTSTGDGTEDYTTLILGILGLAGTIWATFSGLVQHIFRRNVTVAELSRTHSSDPYGEIKDRFKEVTRGKNIAIFIDDLDRCEVEPTVKLLEGIQTLFKQSKVLYVIAADGKWVSNCFTEKYNKFNKLVTKGNTIGNQFLQKSFQLIFDVPKLTKQQIDVILNLNINSRIESGDSEHSSSQGRNNLDSSSLQSRATDENQKELEGNIEKEIQEISEKIEKKRLHYFERLNTETLEHLNLRQIKRLINLFSIRAQSYAAFGLLKDEDLDSLLDAILFSTQYPEYFQRLLQNQTFVDPDMDNTVKSQMDKLNKDVISRYF